MPLIHTPPVTPPPAGPTPGTTYGACQIYVGDLCLTAVDPLGVVWKTLDDQWEGWDDSPASSTDAQQRTLAHGTYSTPGYSGGRYIAAAGTVRAPSHGELHEAFRRLSKTIRFDPFTLRVVEEGGLELTATVKRLGDVKTKTRMETRGQWSISLLADDPRKYSLTEHEKLLVLPSTSGGLIWPHTWPVTWSADVATSSVILTNAGNTAALPVYTITGPVTDPVITHEETGRQMRFGITLAAGQTLTVDTLKHSVVLDGQVTRRNTMSGDWITLPPMAPATIRFTAALGGSTASLAIRYRDTYL